MADDDQQAPPQRYWFPYWTSPPAPAPRPALRPQPSRRDTRPASPQPPPVTPSPSRRQPQPAQAGAGGAGPPQAKPQPTRLSSRPSPSRAHPLSPIREPKSRAAPAPASAPKETKPSVKPATPPQRAAHEEVPKELDIIVSQEKIIHEPPSDTKAHSKAAVEKEKEEEKKDKEKEKDKDGKEKKEKEKEHKAKEKEKEHKEKKEKEKEKEHKEKKEKDKHKEEYDESKLHGGKLHKELMAGVADMVQKLGATTAPSSAGHERHASGAGTTVITLAGENKGASMKISHAEAESKDAAAKERRARKLEDGKQEAHGGKGLTAFVNGNVQVVNNSLVLQSSVSSSDPGVHLKLSTKSKKGDGDEAGGKGGAAAAAKKK